VPTLTDTIEVPAHPTLAAAIVLDWNRDARWRPSVTSFDTVPDGPAVVGQRLFEHLRVAGREVVTATTVTSAVPGRCAAYAGGSGLLHVAGRRQVGPGPDGGSRVRVDLTLTLRGPAAAFAPLLGLVYRRRFRTELRHLARLLDGGYAV
jgi:hypothetical protein